MRNHDHALVARSDPSAGLGGEGAGVDVPPAYRAVRVGPADSAFAVACRLASAEGAGTLIWRSTPVVLEIALVLEPDEPLRTAPRALLLGMVAIAEALGSGAPPEKPVAFDWPDTIRFNGARLGGARLGWPADCAEDQPPDWLVFSAMLAISKADGGDPGLTPESTSFEEEGFDILPEDLVGRFCRYLLRLLDFAAEHGVDTATAKYRDYLPGGPADWRIEANGDAVRLGDGARLALRPALRRPSWLDERTGRPRL